MEADQSSKCENDSLAGIDGYVHDLDNSPLHHCCPTVASRHGAMCCDVMWYCASFDYAVSSMADSNAVLAFRQVFLRCLCCQQAACVHLYLACEEIRKAPLSFAQKSPESQLASTLTSTSDISSSPSARNRNYQVSKQRHSIHRP